MATEADPVNQVQEGGEPRHQPIPDNLLEDLAEKVFHLVQQRQQPRQLGSGGQAQEGARDQSHPESGNQTQSTSSDRSESGDGDQLPSQGEQTGGPSFLAQAGHIKCTPALPPPPPSLSPGCERQQLSPGNEQGVILSHTPYTVTHVPTGNRWVVGPSSSTLGKGVFSKGGKLATLTNPTGTHAHTHTHRLPHTLLTTPPNILPASGLGG